MQAFFARPVNTYLPAFCEDLGVNRTGEKSQDHQHDFHHPHYRRRSIIKRRKLKGGGGGPPWGLQLNNFKQI